MVDFFSNISPAFQALWASLFTYFVTALGASLVFLFPKFNKKLLDSALGFAAGIMISASYFSLLKPSIEITISEGGIKWLPPVAGFLMGGLTLYIIDKLIPHLHLDRPESEKEGIKTNLNRSFLLVFAITLHNIPEGLAIGVAFGALGANIEAASLAGAVSLALGIGIQNFPEGAAVSLPLQREGMGKFKSFFYGQLSGIVEPISALIGASLVLLVKPILPYALSFAAGAMIFVVVEELIPESQAEKNSDIATLSTLFGFAVMMLLDVSFS
ncbi:MAG: ZIP family metal transporter [Acidobacteria bacterium]|nr:ZIP family metal transporter [Acidobacteriota bacterium]